MTSSSVTSTRPDLADSGAHSEKAVSTSGTSTTDITWADSTWLEVQHVREVERVLTPLGVALITVSNVALLLHEGRVVWRCRRLIPPRLLVLILASTDLLATLTGFLPLWVLSDVPQASLRDRSGSPQDPTPLSSLPSLLEQSTPTHRRPQQSAGPDPFRQNVGSSTSYAVVLFLLTTFWTLAQCIVVVMGVERFLALRTPFFYSARCTCRAFCLVLGGLTLASSSLGGFHLGVYLQEIRQHPPVFAGFLDSRSMAHNVSTLVQGVLWTAVLLLCNWGVTRELRRMEERVTVMRMKEQNEYLKQLSMVHGAGREFARFMMAVNFLFLLSSCPNLVCVTLRLCHLAPSFSLQYTCWRMSHISALLNPFLYGFLRKSLRSRIRRFLNQHVKCLRPQRVGQVDTGQVRYHSDPPGAHGANRHSAIVLRDPEASTVHLSD